MFRKTNKEENNNTPTFTAPKKMAAPTVISQDVNILGNLFSDGLIDFDGKIDGNLRGAVLHIRQNAVVNGEAVADEVFVHGRVTGTIIARMVTLHSTAYVDGIVMHEAIKIEDGATVDGKLKKTNKADDGSNSGSYASSDYEQAEPISPSKLMENIRLIASN